MCSLPDLPCASEAPAGLSRSVGRKSGFGAPTEPLAIAFVDGQNLFHCAREAFDYTYPNYDPLKLAAEVCRLRGWQLSQARFYTGVPPVERDRYWHEFWTKKTLRMRRAGVIVVTRPLRYTEKLLEDGRHQSIPREKGVDVRIAIDVLTLAFKNALDVALLFSQDQDLAELATEIRALSQRQGRWLKIASAFPVGPGTRNTRGINDTDWIRIDKATYDMCLDPYA